MKYNSRLYAGQVFHRRVRPRQHILKYSVFTLLIDLSEIHQLRKDLWLFSHNRFNLFSFHDQDFGENPDEALSDYVQRKLFSAGLSTPPARILLSCYPRVLGYAFNPLSLFYCLDEKGRCFAVLHEVHNTFGERHCYVLPAWQSGAESHDEPLGKPIDEPNSDPPSEWIRQNSDKELFVSPFAHMDMHYDFRLNAPAERQVIVIRASDDQGVLITASYTARQKSLSATRLAKYFLVYPLQGIKVIIAIHWQALLLWVKGVPLFKHQPKKSA